MKQKKESLPLLIAEDLDQEKSRQIVSERVRHFSAFLAEKLKVGLDVVHIENSMRWNLPSHKVLSKKYLTQKAQQLKKLAKSFGVKVQLKYLLGDPLMNLLIMSTKTSSYQMMAFATHARKGFKRLALGSIAEEVIRHAKVPVLVCGPKTKKFDENKFKTKKLKILIATDLEKSSLRAEKFAQHLAKKLDAELVLLYCLYEGFHPILQTAFSVPNRSKQMDQFYSQEVKEVEKRLAAKKQKYENAGFQVTTKLDRYSLVASSAILTEVEKSESDLIVMGTHGRNLLTGALLGSNARRIVLESTVPTITVR